MKTIFHQANSRGYADHGWLKSHHSFSFANYYNPERMSFGVLRVLNDDHVAGGMGFGRHPHRNMEIISIPLEGSLRHSDNRGNTGIIEQGDVQVMSAGTGIMHSEENASDLKSVEFLQIWIIPDTEDTVPRYNQFRYSDALVANEFTTIVTPNSSASGASIQQDVWFSIGQFSEDTVLEYSFHKKGNGLYVFVIEGGAIVDNINLLKRDALGIWETDQISLQILASSHVLIMEVPMELPL